MIRYFLLSLLIVSCMAPEGPEQALKNFITYRFSSNQTREKLMDMSSGNMRAQIEVLDEESFNQVYRSGDIKLKKIKINLKNCSETTCSITYTLSFATMKGKKESFRSDVKKVAELVKVEDSWKVSDVTNVKTYIEAKEPISP